MGQRSAKLRRGDFMEVKARRHLAASAISEHYAG